MIMIVRTIHLTTAVTLASVLLLAVGCAASRVDLVETDRVTIAQMASKRMRFAYVDAYRYEDGVSVVGLVRHGRYRRTNRDHVDVRIIGPDGALWNEALGARLRGSGVSYYSRFSVRRLSPPPPGSTIQVAYHGGSFRQSRRPKCRERLSSAAVHRTP